MDNDSAEKKLEVLSDYRKQLDFMVAHVRRKTNVEEEKSVDDWVDWFVRKVERPANQDRSVVKRQRIADGLTNLA